MVRYILKSQNQILMKKLLFLFSLSFALFYACQTNELLEAEIDPLTEINPLSDIEQRATLSLVESPEIMMRHFPSEATARTVYGEPVDVGNGTVRSFVNLSRRGNPTRIGIVLSEGALSGLPHVDHDNPTNGWFVIGLPKEAQKTPYDHISFDWNEQGHEPPGIYDLPHFDVHFYTISLEERSKIPPYSVDPTGFDNAPPAGHLPRPYFNPGGGVPGMGAHWSDPTSPEFNGAEFTSTFIYGTYNGQVNFWEPMITHKLLVSGENIYRSIKQPRIYEERGKYYPTTYGVIYDHNSKKRVISLGDMVRRR